MYWMNDQVDDLKKSWTDSNGSLSLDAAAMIVGIVTCLFLPRQPVAQSYPRRRACGPGRGRTSTRARRGPWARRSAVWVSSVRPSSSGHGLELQPGPARDSFISARRRSRRPGRDLLDAPEVERVADAQLVGVAPAAPQADAADDPVEQAAELPGAVEIEPAAVAAEPARRSRRPRRAAPRRSSARRSMIIPSLLVSVTGGRSPCDPDERVGPAGLDRAGARAPRAPAARPRRSPSARRRERRRARSSSRTTTSLRTPSISGCAIERGIGVTQ